jgi:hypoxanthine phosphoribosyltransferase
MMNLSYFLTKYKKEDFRRLSWKEYDKTLENIHRQVAGYLAKSHLKVDAIVPILRGGAVPANYLSYKLKILRMLPVQYKYFYVAGGKMELRRLSGIRKGDVGRKNPVFLVVEGNHCFGVTAQAVIDDIKRIFPGSRIVYAADHGDYSYRKLKSVDAAFYGKLTNETRALTDKQCRAKGVENGSFIFPWENFDEEWDTVNAKQYRYQDLKESIRHSALRKSIKM